MVAAGYSNRREIAIAAIIGTNPVHTRVGASRLIATMREVFGHDIYIFEDRQVINQLKRLKRVAQEREDQYIARSMGDPIAPSIQTTILQDEGVILTARDGEYLIRPVRTGGMVITPLNDERERHGGRIACVAILDGGEYMRALVNRVEVEE